MLSVKHFYSNVRQYFRVSGRFHLLWCSIFMVTIFLYFNPKIYKQEKVENVVNFQCHSQDSARNLQLHQICDCPRAQQHQVVSMPQSRKNIESSCSDHATFRGPGQKVVSFSFYGNVDNRYFNGTEYNTRSVMQMYPGWVMRLYHNISIKDPKESKVLCQVWCENDHLDLCDVRNLPSKLGDQSTTFGMLWRFFVLGDPLVKIFLIRDLDSAIIQREVDAVDHWLYVKNKPTWHIMRDHVLHNVPILGGMWDGRNENLSLTTELRQKFIARGQQWRKGYDQDLLREFLWPIAQHDMVSHDSYLCKYFYGSQPWPTKRNGTQFVGDIFPWLPPVFTVEICPKECRPQNHQDWFYC